MQLRWDVSFSTGASSLGVFTQAGRLHSGDLEWTETLLMQAPNLSDHPTVAGACQGFCMRVLSNRKLKSGFQIGWFRNRLRQTRRPSKHVSLVSRSAKKYIGVLAALLFLCSFVILPRFAATLIELKALWRPSSLLGQKLMAACVSLNPSSQILKDDPDSQSTY